MPVLGFNVRKQHLQADSISRSAAHSILGRKDHGVLCVAPSKPSMERKNGSCFSGAVGSSSSGDSYNDETTHL